MERRYTNRLHLLRINGFAKRAKVLRIIPVRFREGFPGGDAGLGTGIFSRSLQDLIVRLQAPRISVQS